MIFIQFFVRIYICSKILSLNLLEGILVDTTFKYLIERVVLYDRNILKFFSNFFDFESVVIERMINYFPSSI